MKRIRRRWPHPRGSMNRAVAALLLLALPFLATSCGNGPQMTSTGGPTAGSLVAVGKMTIGRSLHTATLLPTSEVLLTGGGTPDLHASGCGKVRGSASGQKYLARLPLCSRRARYF